ncbi:ATP-binding protein [Flavobacterium sp. Fl-77]|uniref:ATP-binding protein n=1 Tax=Flavobacterium flavipigmentatum TaxID=2893884 RepID=A0AAJ2W045_9FLAO|nr:MULTISPECIES: ATP-binding protein [unclassified Flavobacterium]MDX6181104.1 ATP-binding protein [Flavobacterium sp. Fl-33]MDX6184705.1 ATP-binding protein [Flavobacterium sp. Fl-77]UFH39805.1 AAA family ATPase [Flavobacterium sp. F-70]
MKLFENIYFVGGIHGVGKGTVCKEIASKTRLIHITASQVLKWNEISFSENKLVKDLSSTQERLIVGLENLIEKNKEYLLDGHFCLLNSSAVPCRIDEDVFDQINPRAIAIVIDDVKIIVKRLESRDDKIYKISILNELQQMEIEYAKYLSKKYCVPYIEIINNNYERFLDILNR